MPLAQELSTEILGKRPSEGTGNKRSFDFVTTDAWSISWVIANQLGRLNLTYDLITDGMLIT